MWPDPQRLLSYDRLFNIIDGARDIGKTYSFLSEIVDRIMLHPGMEEFIYVRRYRDELDNEASFMRSLWHDKYESVWNLRVKGGIIGVQVRDGQENQRDNHAPWVTIGRQTAINTVQFKRMGQDYPLVTRVYFDEFMPIDCRYLGHGDEVTWFENFVYSITRHRDNVRVIMMSNSRDIANPYFLRWGITPDEREFQKFLGNQGVYWHCPIVPPRSRIGIAISLTRTHGEVEINNEYATDKRGQIAPISRDTLTPRFQLKCLNDEILYVWRIKGVERRYYVSRMAPRGWNPLVLTTNLEAVHAGGREVWVDRSHTIVKSMTNDYREGVFVFESLIALRLWQKWLDEM